MGKVRTVPSKESSAGSAYLSWSHKSISKNATLSTERIKLPTWLLATDGISGIPGMRHSKLFVQDDML